MRRSYYHYSIFDRIRSADRTAVEFNRDFPPVHSPNLIEAAPGVHPAKARRMPNHFWEVKKSVLFLLGRAIVVRAFLTVIMGAMLLGGCAEKTTEGSVQAVSAQED